jgi:very-short-patch-repair endonuclease
MSLPEVLVWQRLKGGKAGLSFRKQHPIGPYLVDFYCSDGASVIEIDGEAHERGTAPKRDADRDAFLTENGYRVLRITAAEVLRDVDAAVQGTVVFVESPLHHASHGPPPRAGETLQ